MSSKNIRKSEESNEDLLSAVGSSSTGGPSDADLLESVDASSAPSWRPTEEDRKSVV